MTELNSPQRPHCLASFVGSFTIGLVAAVTAKLPCARSSALLSAGPRRRDFIAQPSSGACDARSRSCARPDFPCSDLPFSNPLCAPAWRSLPHERPWRQCPAKKCAAKPAWRAALLSSPKESVTAPGASRKRRPPRSTAAYGLEAHIDNPFFDDDDDRAGRAAPGAVKPGDSSARAHKARLRRRAGSRPARSRRRGRGIPASRARAALAA